MKKFPTDISLNECSLTREVVGHYFTFLLTHHCWDTAWLLNAQCFHCLKHIHKSLCFITLDRIDQGTEYSTATHSITEKVIKEHTSSFYINYRIGKFFFFNTLSFSASEKQTLCCCDHRMLKPFFNKWKTPPPSVDPLYCISLSYCLHISVQPTILMTNIKGKMAST